MYIQHCTGKTPGGAAGDTQVTGHTRATRGRTRAHGPHRRTSQPAKPTNTQPARQRDDRSRGRLNSRKPEADRSPRPTQKRPPPANPTLPPPAPRAPPRAYSKAVGEMKARAAALTGRPLLRDSLKHRFSTGSFSIVFSDGCDGAARHVPEGRPSRPGLFKSVNRNSRVRENESYIFPYVLALRI